MECPRCAGLKKNITLLLHMAAPGYVIYKCPSCGFIRRFERKDGEKLTPPHPQREENSMSRVKSWKGVTVLCVGISAITTMELFAMSHGIDGILLTGSIATVAALVAGYCGFKWNKKEITNGN